MTARIWERINPRDFADGVYYVPADLELQPRLPQWGHPGLRERVANDRPHGISGEKLLCLLCMRIRAERGMPVEPVWLTFVEDRRTPFFRHEDGRSPHAEHQPESDIHKALKEREARTLQAAGALDVNVEVWRPRARRKPDVVAVGPTLTLAGEVQHSKESPRVIQARQRALSKAGDRVVWTTDRNPADIGFLHLVPHLVVPSLDDHHRYLREPRLNIGAGALTFEEQRCGWADLWNGNDTRCPITRRSMSCGRTHLYPTLNPREYTRTAAAGGEFPCGPRPHLDHLLEGILHGSWLPYRHRNRVTWIPANVHDQVAAERGGSVEQAEAADVRRRDRPAGRACEDRVGRGIPAQREAPAAERLTPCCGGRAPGRPGAPLVPACLLCPKSPTYWRRNEINPEGDQA